MAIRTVVTRGFGNSTFNGTIPLVVTRGYAIGVEADLPEIIYATSVALSTPSATSVALSTPSATGIALEP